MKQIIVVNIAYDPATEEVLPTVTGIGGVKPTIKDALKVLTAALVFYHELINVMPEAGDERVEGGLSAVD